MAKNVDRAAQTKARLVAAARKLFASDGYGATGTEAILAEAGATRGALYHHYRDKADLFEAVCRDLAGEAAREVEAATDGIAAPVEALKAGSRAWIDFMARPECRRILVVDAPGVLGRERWEELDRDLSFDLLKTGVDGAVEAGAIRFDAGAEALSVLLNGAMNQIALRAGDEADTERLTAGLLELLDRLGG
ncbi:MAG: TetR/AcrR family transcriptional regulator [Rhizobiaceae bacterium]|nr:TetR/AcrR family transcriptional regulator [Rhizobiaceae bacterium]MCV0405450.1 TetR/AcrR family transcriptional regulator [Rhizobiaceae bacterium]